MFVTYYAYLVAIQPFSQQDLVNKLARQLNPDASTGALLEISRAVSERNHARTTNVMADCRDT